MTEAVASLPGAVLSDVTPVTLIPFYLVMGAVLVVLHERGAFEAAKSWLGARPRAQSALLTLYYLAMIAALLAMYGRGNFETPEYVYQEF